MCAGCDQLYCQALALRRAPALRPLRAASGRLCFGNERMLRLVSPSVRALLLLRNLELVSEAVLSA